MKNDIQHSPVTIGDVARLAGVAKSTASAALSNKNGRHAVAPEKREAILRVAQELGFQANPHAQRLSKGRCHNMIGVFSLDLDLGCGTVTVKTIQKLLAARGYDVPIYSYGSVGGGEEVDQSTLLKTVCAQRPLAIVCSTSGMNDEGYDVLAQYQDQGGLVVCYDHKANMDCDNLVSDRAYNTYLATRHLLELGHRDVGLFVHGAPPVGGERLEGFERALNEHHLKARPEWICGGGLYEAGGAELAERFLSWQERPTGMVIVGDYSALSFISQLQKGGLQVPRDVSVVSHDDMPVVQYCAVPLTVLSHSNVDNAAHVVQLLLDRLDGKYTGPPRQITTHGNLVVRESTSAPPALQ